MTILEQARRKPKTMTALATIAALGGAIAAMKHIAWVWNAVPTAYAGQMMAEENREWIQKQETINETLKDILQQQQIPRQQVTPNAAVVPEVWIEYEEDGSCWVCQAYGYSECWDKRLWQICDEGRYGK
jgi:heme/copper-type cytochrome/quinol oxidase subunit 1